MPIIQLNGKNSNSATLIFDLENEVLKPLNQGYTREAVAKLDSIFDKILEVKIRQKFVSKDAQKIISILLSSKTTSLLSLIAYKSKVITKSQKEKIEKFKSFRNIILHNAFGELNIYTKEKPKNLNKFIKNEIEKSIYLLRSIISNNKN